MPLWVKLAYSAFLALLVPVYWRRYGPGNFLWFSDVALFLVAAALWLESPLIGSAAALGVLVLEVGWNVEYFVRLLTGRRMFGLTDYMFDASLPRWLRAVSLFHVALPPLLVWMLARLGYDRRALVVQTAIAWIVLPATYFLTDPSKDVNWVHGHGLRPAWMRPAVFVGLLMIAIPLLVYVPTHLLLRAVFPLGHSESP